MIKVKRFGILSFAKLQAVLASLLGVLAGILYSFGGAATVAGSLITGAASLGLIATGTVLVGAAPVLLGVGAIAAGGALAYDLLRDTSAVKNTNQNIETAANKTGGYVDDAFASGQSLVNRGLPPALAVPVEYDSALKQATEAVQMSANQLISDLKSGISTFKEDVSQIFEK